MVEVIEPNWHNFEAAFQKVRTVDEVLKIHTDFVDSCLHECMLTDPRLVKVFISPFLHLSKLCFNNYSLVFDEVNGDM